MPYGKGTYGTKRGRPPVKKKVKKLAQGGTFGEEARRKKALAEAAAEAAAKGAAIEKTKKLKKLEAEGQFAGGPGKVQTTQKSKRDDVDPRIGTGKGSDDAGPAGQEARRTKAKIDTKGMTPSRKLAKDEGKISESDMVKGRRDTTAAAKQKAKKEKEDLRKRNLAGQRMGQRKAGGMIKKYSHGGKVGMKKCPRDGIAIRGKTRG